MIAKSSLRVLVTGASGMLGASLTNSLVCTGYNVYATGNSRADFLCKEAKFCITDLKSESFKGLLEWSKPDVIIICAAITDSNYCNQHPYEAIEVNAFSVKRLAEQAKNNVKFIFISTDAVFSSSTHMAVESDCCNPETVYGKSKELGEFLLQKSDKKFFIIRTTIVGLNLNRAKTSFAEWILASARGNQPINLFEDVLFTPISIWHLIDEIKFLLKIDRYNNSTYHICSTNYISKYSFGVSLLKLTHPGYCLINRSSIEDYAGRIGRSSDQTLSSKLYQNTFDRFLPSAEEACIAIGRNYDQY